MPYICELPQDGGDYVDDGKGNEKGQCVSLIKKMAPRIPATALWKVGAAVKGNASLPSGTAIASFDPKTGKHWHAAIYVRQDAAGIWVWDQYSTGVTRHPPRLNHLRWKNDHHPHVAGSNFHVIE